jgi:hypothetical protein
MPISRHYMHKINSAFCHVFEIGFNVYLRVDFQIFPPRNPRHRTLHPSLLYLYIFTYENKRVYMYTFQICIFYMYSYLCTQMFTYLFTYTNKHICIHIKISIILYLLHSRTSKLQIFYIYHYLPP